MSRTAVIARGVASPDGIGDAVTVLVEDGAIEAILPGRPPVEAEQIVGDGTDVVAPGLIDIHTHGGEGVQAIDGDPAALTRLAAFYARHGVTGFLGTIGGRRADIESGLRGLTALIAGQSPPTGAACLGIHLEGPFISPERPGAFRPDSIVPPDAALFEHYAELAGGSLALVTLAPELDGQRDVIAAARARGVLCSAGHSTASEIEMAEAIDRGVTSLTHMFNAMPALHHREPGIVGVGLTEPRLTAELIGDGVHVHPTVVRLLLEAKGWAGVALITDSIAAAGLPDGRSHYEGQDVIVANGEARLADGTLAGSTLTLDVAVDNVARFTGIPWVEALASASLVPARLLGLDDRKGRVAVGYDADLVGFDADRGVRWTMVGGTVVHERGAV